MKLRKKFWNDYISQRKRYKTDKEFITQWCEKRGEITVEGEMTITKSTASKLLTQFKANEGIVYTKKRLGVKPKINDSSRLCILATIMDYPFMTDKERSVYLNTYGPNDENKVTKKTVNNELNNLNFHIKAPSFSPKERNTFGFLVARYLWGHVISDIMHQLKMQEVIFLFLNCDNTNCHCSWYAQFIREAACIIRTKICKSDNQIVIINDNASIHKTQNVFDVVEENKINFFFTVPYSPQSNLPAENYFSRMKLACLFELFIIDDEVRINDNDGFIVNDDGKESNETPINGTSYHFTTISSIIQRWDYLNREKYDSEASMNIFHAWETVLKDCKAGKELTGQHYKIQKQSIEKINCLCYRR
ncbi:hypothetical protein M9Y10_031089 [Tritrichomonas musculus]|uniref:Tc1-like transposase DDE domain-containing protein n=1 Tax=Tritrichomonas musculus TaxID=1915356 RepID=A0ABR2H1W3_9EUKA